MGTSNTVDQRYTTTLEQRRHFVRLPLSLASLYEVHVGAATLCTRQLFAVRQASFSSKAYSKMTSVCLIFTV